MNYGVIIWLSLLVVFLIAEASTVMTCSGSASIRAVSAVMILVVLAIGSGVSQRFS